MWGNLVFRVAHFPHVGNFGVVRLPQQLNEAIGLEQSVFPAAQCDHPESQRFVRYRWLEFG